MKRHTDYFLRMPKRTAHKYGTVEVYEDENGNLFEFKPQSRKHVNIQYGFEKYPSRNSTGWKKHKGRHQWVHNLRPNAEFVEKEWSYKKSWYIDAFIEVSELTEEDYIELYFSLDYQYCLG